MDILIALFECHTRRAMKARQYTLKMCTLKMYIIYIIVTSSGRKKGMKGKATENQTWRKQAITSEPNFIAQLIYPYLLFNRIDISITVSATTTTTPRIHKIFWKVIPMKPKKDYQTNCSAIAYIFGYVHG